MSYYSNNAEFINILSDFFFTKRQVHLGIAKKLQVGDTADMLKNAVSDYLYSWITANPNGLKFYSNRIKDRNKPKIADEINDTFIIELVKNIMDTFKNLDDMFNVIISESEKRDIIAKKNMEYDALSDEEKQKLKDQKIVEYLDYWASKGHAVN